ncbi:E3 ubiquitin-protein ligase TRIM39 [Salminus brasiliensis]|uniref:E3 ubiquitin-protein ligase TRIM39 n=1 Tax=Salminus brasiliensis TaxID=930266 RepID=UPI003B830B42
MATNLSVSEHSVTCPICCEVFNEPVVLKCSHSFCEECLQRYWRVQEVLLCPVCRKQCSQDEPTRSLAFASLCGDLKSRKCSPFAAPPGDMCPEHEEKLKLFCFEDKQPICVVCYTSKKHKNHQCAPIVEAVEDLKAEVKSEVSGVLQNLQTLNKSKADYEVLAEALKEERQSVENMIRQEFDSLHQFLREEEEARIAALKQEELQKSEKTKNRIEKLSYEISNLSMTLKMINQEMEMNELTFLQNYASGHYSPAKYILPEPNVISGIDTAKHLGFLNMNLRAKMCDLLHDPPKSVTLDPNTASNKLVVSEDLSSVYFVEQKQEVTDNPERMILGVLGSQGFSSGLHCWDVEVGDNDHWTIGVVRQSVERKKLLKMDPSSGVWSIRFINGKYRVKAKSRKELAVPEKPRVIRVQLDYDKGVITFSDPSKGPILFSFTDTFEETLFPYFNTASTICPLNIC